MDNWWFFLRLMATAMYGNLIPIPGLGGLLFGLLVGVLITSALIRTEVKQQVPDAFKVLITSKSVKTVKVGVFDEDDRKLNDIEMGSIQGVADDVYEGQTIYC